jgi:hypothetical protein
MDPGEPRYALQDSAAPRMVAVNIAVNVVPAVHRNHLPDGGPREPQKYLEGP